MVKDVIFARRAMDDAAFRRDRLIEAAKRLGVRVDELSAVEKARAQRAEHEQVLAERDRLGDVLERRLAKIGHREIEPPLDLLVGLLGKADRSGFGDAL